MRLIGKIKSFWEGLSKKPQVFKKKKTWKTLAKKYKYPPCVRIEDFAKHKEVHFYPKSVQAYKEIYKLPLTCTRIVYLSKYFPDEVDFFEDLLLKTFRLVRRYER